MRTTIEKDFEIHTNRLINRTYIRISADVERFHETFFKTQDWEASVFDRDTESWVDIDGIRSLLSDPQRTEVRDELIKEYERREAKRLGDQPDSTFKVRGPEYDDDHISDGLDLLAEYRLAKGRV